MTYQAANLHMEFKIVTVHTAKCDVCNERNKNTLKRCETCGYSVCGPCFLDRAYDSGHLINTGDTAWTVARASMPLKETKETTKAGASKKPKTQKVEKRPVKAKAPRKPAPKRATAAKSTPKSTNERPFRETEALCQNAEALGDANVLTRPRLRLRAPKPLATGNDAAKTFIQSQQGSAGTIGGVERDTSVEKPVSLGGIASGDPIIAQSPSDRRYGWTPINVPSHFSGIELLLNAAASIENPESKQDLAIPGSTTLLETELVHEKTRYGQGTKSKFDLSGNCRVDRRVAKSSPLESLSNLSVNLEEATASAITPLVSPTSSRLDTNATVPDDHDSDSLFFPRHISAKKAIGSIIASPTRQDGFKDLHPSISSTDLGEKRQHGGIIVDLTVDNVTTPLWKSSSVGNHSRESKRPRLSASEDQVSRLFDKATVTRRTGLDDEGTEEHISVGSSMTSDQFESAIMPKAAPLSRKSVSRVHSNKRSYDTDEVSRQEIRDELYLEVLREVCKEVRDRLGTLHRDAMPEPVDKLRAMRERTLRGSMNPTELKKREQLMKEVADLERMIRRPANVPPTSLSLSPYAL